MPMTASAGVWNRQRYQEAVRLGLIGSDEKVELLEGEITPKMPMNDPHRSAIGAMQEALARIFGAGFWLCIQMPFAATDLSMPEPDLAVVSGSWRDYRDAPPTGRDIRLVVEVSDSTLLKDRTFKAAIYAQAGIEEYWIVNLPERTLEVRRRPGQDGYAEVSRLGPNESVSPLAAPGASVAVADLLP